MSGWAVGARVDTAARWRVRSVPADPV